MAHYDRLAKEYFERRDNLERFDFNRDIEVPAMIKMVGNVKNKSIFDIGCGFADHLVKLSSKEPKNIVGVDLSCELINIAKSLNIKNSNFYVHDIRKKLNENDENFDLAFSSLVVHYLSPKELDNLFSEINRILKKGGEFIFSTGHPLFNLRKTRIGELLKNMDNEVMMETHYFNEGPHEVELGSTIGKVPIYNFTFETLIKTALKNNFEIIDYIDAKPTESSKIYDKYRYASTMPTFILFKLRKK